MSFIEALSRITEIQGVIKSPNPLPQASQTQNFGEVLAEQLQNQGPTVAEQGNSQLSSLMGPAGLSGLPSQGLGTSGASSLLGIPQTPQIASPAFLSPNPITSGNLDQNAYQTRLQAAEEIAGRFGLKVSSGYRDPEHNARVGGVPNSLHTQGLGFDFTGPSEALNQAKSWAASHPELFQEVLVHNAGSGIHLHLGFRSS